MKNILKQLILWSVCLYIPLESLAWGQTGHRVVGQVAETYLTKRVKKQVAAILGTESIAMASNWSDFIKSDTTNKHLDPWHYVNLNSGLSYDSVKRHLETSTGFNIYNRINFLIAELKRNDLTIEQKQFNLKFLIHLIGDLHQPMHVGRPDDRGGNNIKVKWFNNNSNLHRVWDEDLIGHQQLSYTEFATVINHTTKQQREQIRLTPLTEWVFKSYQEAEKIYAYITEPDQRLDYKYNYMYQSTLHRQLLEGGVHLAMVLNDIFG